MGVLCVAVDVAADGGRFLIVTGGDDQAVCIAEVEVVDRTRTGSDAERCQAEESRDDLGRSEGAPTRSRYAIRARPSRGRINCFPVWCFVYLTESGGT